MTTIDTPQGIELFHLASQKAALKLEMLGLKHSRGSVSAHLKRTHGWKGNKEKILAQLEALIKQKEKEAGIER